MTNKPTAFVERAHQHFSDDAYAVLDVVTAQAAEKNATPSQVALAWVAQQPGITSPIIGPRTMDHLRDNLGAAELVITDDDRARLDAVSPPERALVPYYGGHMMDFRPPQHRW